MASGLDSGALNNQRNIIHPVFRGPSRGLLVVDKIKPGHASADLQLGLTGWMRVIPEGRRWLFDLPGGCPRSKPG